MWYEKNNLVVRTWILDFSRSIYDEIDIIPWILRLIICCLANNRNLCLILAELEQLSMYNLTTDSALSKFIPQKQKQNTDTVPFSWEV